MNIYRPFSAQSNLVSQGKALSLAIRGLMSIGDVCDGFGTIEEKVRTQLIRLYQRELKRILREVTDEDVNEILAVIGPRMGTITIDPSLN